MSSAWTSVTGSGFAERKAECSSRLSNATSLRLSRHALALDRIQQQLNRDSRQEYPHPVLDFQPLDSSDRFMIKYQILLVKSRQKQTDALPYISYTHEIAD